MLYIKRVAKKQPNCVRVAQQTLTLYVWVRILVRLPKNHLRLLSQVLFYCLAGFEPRRGNRTRPLPVADKGRVQSCAAVEKRVASATSLRVPQTGAYKKRLIIVVRLPKILVQSYGDFYLSPIHFSLFPPTLKKYSSFVFFSCKMYFFVL